MLLAVLAALKAADYWVDRYETTNERRGFVQGATYAVVNAQLPALMLLMLIALLTAGLYLSTIRTGSWRLPLIASALWLVVLDRRRAHLPGARAVARRQPEPGSRARRRTSTATSSATREAMGINTDDVDVRRRSTFGTLDRRRRRGRPRPAANVRLLNPTEMLSRFRIDRGEEAGLTIDDLDVDRYALDGAACSRC